MIVVKHTTDFMIGYYDKFNLQEHQEVFPSIPLETKYT